MSGGKWQGCSKGSSAGVNSQGNVKVLARADALRAASRSPQVNPKVPSFVEAGVFLWRSGIP